MKQTIVTLDLEGVLVPEIWIAVAEKTGIEALKLTTRDVADYDELMRGRLRLLEENRLTLGDIQEVIGTLTPLDGAKPFLDALRAEFQVILLSDTFAEFASPLMKQLSWPTIFCHNLVIRDGRIVDYRLRQKNQKQRAVRALKELNYHVLSAGDSYNDTTMLEEADRGYLFHAPDNVKSQFPQFASTEEYGELLALIREADRSQDA